MKLKAQRCVAGKLILKQALTAFQENKKKNKRNFRFLQLRYPLDGPDKKH